MDQTRTNLKRFIRWEIVLGVPTLLVTLIWFYCDQEDKIKRFFGFNQDKKEVQAVGEVLPDTTKKIKPDSHIVVPPVGKIPGQVQLSFKSNVKKQLDPSLVHVKLRGIENRIAQLVLQRGLAGQATAELNFRLDSDGTSKLAVSIEFPDGQNIEFGDASEGRELQSAFTYLMDEAVDMIK